MKIIAERNTIQHTNNIIGAKYQTIQLMSQKNVNQKKSKLVISNIWWRKTFKIIPKPTKRIR